MVTNALLRRGREAESSREFRDYCLYGIALRSEIPLTYPEQPTSGAADVTFSFAPQHWFTEVTAGLPRNGNAGDWCERVRCPDGSDYLRFPALFEFIVSPDGRSVACLVLERATVESFQAYLLGHVLSYALVKQGYEPLHATAVAIEGAAVAFLGASGQGKSTLAAAFLQAGHRILTDDLLLVRDVGGVLCGWPGPPRIKLFPHVAERFLPKQISAKPMNPDTTKLMIPLERHQRLEGPVPIQSFCVLEDCEQDAGIRLSSLSGTESVIQLLASTFNTRVVTSERLRRQFLVTREWLTRTPVWRLQYPRAMADIDLVREAILSRALSSERPSERPSERTLS
jgi:hypothetical protein